MRNARNMGIREVADVDIVLHGATVESGIIGTKQKYACRSLYYPEGGAHSFRNKDQSMGLSFPLPSAMSEVLSRRRGCHLVRQCGPWTA